MISELSYETGCMAALGMFKIATPVKVLRAGRTPTPVKDPFNHFNEINPGGKVTAPPAGQGTVAARPANVAPQANTPRPGNAPPQATMTPQAPGVAPRTPGPIAPVPIPGAVAPRGAPANYGKTPAGSPQAGAPPAAQQTVVTKAWTGTQGGKPPPKPPAPPPAAGGGSQGGDNSGLWSALQALASSQGGGGQTQAPPATSGFWDSMKGQIAPTLMMAGAPMILDRLFNSGSRDPYAV